jgi:hypothetical protein|tara:strand:+ start:437 stop:538 length:102 start_codon:yes stop_codon:yes gene_type:complete
MTVDDDDGHSVVEGGQLHAENAAEVANVASKYA